jgi:predicted peptidase
MLALRRFSSVWLGLSLFVVGCAAPLGPTSDTPKATAKQPEVSAEVLAAYRPVEVKRDDVVVLRYRVLAPKPAFAREFPLVIVLHGSGERGDDNTRQLIHGAAEFLEHSRRHPAYYVFPQCPEGTWWDRPNPLRDEPFVPGVVPPMDELVDLIHTLIAEKPIDPRRVYVTGLSMGGFGTYALVARLPETFAAAMPICGGGDVRDLPRYARTPFWVFHGDADTAVDVEYSRSIIAAMQKAGVPVQYTEYPGGNHNAWTPTYQDNSVIDWLFAQRRR